LLLLAQFHVAWRGLLSQSIQGWPAHRNRRRPRGNESNGFLQPSPK